MLPRKAGIICCLALSEYALTLQNGLFAGTLLCALFPLCWSGTHFHTTLFDPLYCLDGISIHAGWRGKIYSVHGSTPDYPNFKR